MKRLKALVASEDDDWRSLFADELTENDCEVDTTSDGMEVLNLVRKHRYVVVVVDEVLEKMNQLEVILNLRDLMPEMPVVVVTGRGVEKQEKVWRHCKVYYAGTRSSDARRMHEAVRVAKSQAVAMN